MMLNRLFILIIGIAFVGCGSEDVIIKTYFPNGVLESEVTYTKGVKNGSFTYYWENGFREREGVFLNDTLDGTLIHYSANGVDTNRIHKYETGEIIEIIDYTTDAPLIKINHKEKLITVYDEFGKIDSTIEMK